MLEQLAYVYDVDVIFSKKWNAEGVFLLPRTICISPLAEEPLETFFHELGHVRCYRKKIFPAYHRYKNKKYTRQAVLSTAFRAERYVDKWAEKECRSWFPNYKWVGCYKTEKERQSLLAYYDGDKFNNNLDNLRWDTCKNNCKDTKRHGRCQTGQDHHSATLTNKQANRIKEYLAVGISPKDIAEQFNINRHTVYNIKEGVCY